jgi:hypothetical protein
MAIHTAAQAASELPAPEPSRGRCRVWIYMGPARLQPVLTNFGSKVTPADVYPAPLFGLIDHSREP